MARKPYYIVVCKDRRGVYVFATSRHFPTYSDAKLYTQSIAVAREPIVVMVD